MEHRRELVGIDRERICDMSSLRVVNLRAGQSWWVATSDSCGHSAGDGGGGAEGRIETRHSRSEKSWEAS